MQLTLNRWYSDIIYCYNEYNIVIYQLLETKYTISYGVCHLLVQYQLYIYMYIQCTHIHVVLIAFANVLFIHYQSISFSVHPLSIYFSLPPSLHPSTLSTFIYIYILEICILSTRKFY